MRSLYITIRACDHPLLFHLLDFFLILYVLVFCTVRMQCLLRPEEDIRSFGTGVTTVVDAGNPTPSPCESSKRS